MHGDLPFKKGYYGKCINERRREVLYKYPEEKEVKENGW